MCEDQVEASGPVYHPPEFIKDGWYHFVETFGMYGYVKAFGPFRTEAEAISDQQSAISDRHDCPPPAES